jgi:hypothetical protein
MACLDFVAESNYAEPYARMHCKLLKLNERQRESTQARGQPSVGLSLPSSFQPD